jgi:hypothetical protein
VTTGENVQANGSSTKMVSQDVDHPALGRASLGLAPIVANFKVFCAKCWHEAKRGCGGFESS